MNHPLNAATLETGRLVLRAVDARDYEGMHRIYQDPEALKYWSNPPVENTSETRRLVDDDIEAMLTGRGIFWTVLLKGELIGKCVLFHYDHQNSRAEVGYLLNRDFWGKGLMIEAMREVVRHAFSELDLHRLEADVDTGNVASLRLLQKLGFRKEGYFRDRWNVYGEWTDSVMLGLLRPDWLARNG